MTGKEVVKAVLPWALILDEVLMVQDTAGSRYHRSVSKD